MHRFFLIALTILGTLSAQLSYEPHQLERQVDTVLLQRDAYYQRILGTAENIDSLLQSGSNWKLELSQYQQPRSMWYTFLMGVSNANSETLQNNFFQNSLTLAGNDQAELWVLFLEFIRIGNFSSFDVSKTTKCWHLNIF